MPSMSRIRAAGSVPAWILIGAIAAPAAVSAVTAAGDEKGPITKRTVKSAETMIGLEFTPDERKMMLEGLNDLLDAYKEIRAASIPNDLPPADYFNPLAGLPVPAGDTGPEVRSRVTAPPVPANLEDLAFLPVTELGELIRQRKITSTQLTKMYLARLKRLGPKLECVITLTEDLALKQAARADAEIAAGHYRGPLHGIPWGAKDLLAAKGYPTTWGAMPYKDQVIDLDATVVKKLEDAGAVLLAKLTLGALAYGDVWYGGKTRNPWNLGQGSSGSSAGPASATVAGLVGFSIGSETLGSIVSPSTRCGATGLRPTYGHVSRYGAMALSWTMDKLGPICRAVEDCALVMEAIQGPDGKDASVIDVPFVWNAGKDPRKLRVGYAKALFETDLDPNNTAAKESREHDLATLDKLKEIGFDLVPVELPDVPADALSIILNAEASAAFDDLTRSGKDDLLVRQQSYAWPNYFRFSRFVPAVEYIQASRLRTRTIRDMAKLMETVDVYVAPSFGGRNLLMTNLTGHPALVLPNGFRKDGTPTSITFTGKLFGEEDLLTVAKAYQDATDFHQKHPDVDAAEKPEKVEEF